MAIDPSIIMQGYVPEGIDFAKLANIRGTMASARATEASIPGIKAESKIKERKASYPDYAARHPEFINQETGELDHTKLLPQALADGYATEAAEALKVDLANKQARIQNAKDETSAQNAQLELIKALGTTAANYTSLAPKGQEAQMAEFVAGQLEAIVPGSGQKTIQSMQVTNPDGSLGFDKEGKPVIDKGKVRAMRLINLDPQQREVLAQSAYSSGMNLGPEARDPTSELSIAAQNAAIAAGVPRDLVINQPYAAIQNIPLVKDIQKTLIQSQESIEAGVRNASEMFAAATVLKNLNNEVKAIVHLLPEGNMTQNWFETVKSKFAAQPEVLAVLAKLEAEAAAHNINLSVTNAKAIDKALAAQAKNFFDIGMDKESNAKRVYNRAPIAKPNMEPSAPPPVTAPTPQTAAAPKEQVSRSDYERVISAGMKRMNISREKSEAIFRKNYPNVEVTD